MGLRGEEGGGGESEDLSLYFFLKRFEKLNTCGNGCW